jgi:hypothetical protein
VDVRHVNGEMSKEELMFALSLKDASLHANQSNKSNINPLTHSAEGAI